TIITRSQTPFGNAVGETLFCIWALTRNRVSIPWFPNRVWEPGALAVLACIMLASAGCGHVGDSASEPLPSITTKSGIEMVLIPSGTFQMGSRHGKEDEGPVHTVTIASFLMDKYEVSQADYERLGLSNLSHFKGPTLPMEQVTWVQAANYCNKRSAAEGLKPCYNEDTAECNFDSDGYRLPTEAEWE